MNSSPPRHLQNLAEARSYYRHLYLTQPAVTEIIDHLVSQTSFPDHIRTRFNEQDLCAIAHDFWLFGWVVIDNIRPLIYNPDDIRVVRAQETYRILYDHGGITADITEDVTLIARRFSSSDLLGHSAIEALIIPASIEWALCVNQFIGRMAGPIDPPMIMGTFKVNKDISFEKDEPVLPGRSRYDILRGVS